MYQFFVDEQQVQQDQIVITGQDVNHIGNVLRMKPGEKVRISDSNENSYFCRIAEIAEDEVIVVIEEKDELGTEFAHKVFLFQGLPKSDKMELIIQKAVELGVYEVIPVAMTNCVVKLDQKKAANKQKRWQAIAESAAKQSKRTVIPQVQMPVSWKEAVELAEFLRDLGYMPEQVQDFYPTPSSISTRMYYTGVDPRTMQPIYVAINPHEKAMQRALIQYRNPKNYDLV